MDAFLQRVFQVSALRTYLIDGTITKEINSYLHSNTHTQPKLFPVCMELSAPAVNATQVQELFRLAPETRTSTLGFHVLNAFKSGRGGEALLGNTTHIEPFPDRPRTVINLDQNGNYFDFQHPRDEHGEDEDGQQNIMLPFFSDPPSSIHNSKDNQSLPANGRIGEDGILEFHEDDIEPPGAVYLNVPKFVIGQWMAGETVSSDEGMRLRPMLARLGVQDYTVESCRFVGYKQTGEKIEYAELSTGHSVLIYLLYGELSPILMEAVYYMGKPIIYGVQGWSPSPFRVGRMRCINLSECEDCRWQGRKLCNCIQSAPMRGEGPSFGSSYDQGEPWLRDTVDVMLVKRARERENMAYAAMNMMEPVCQGPRLPPCLIPPPGCTEFVKLSSWFRIQYFSANNTLKQEGYHLLQCRPSTVSHDHVALFRALYPKERLASSFLSPRSEVRLLLPIEEEFESLKANTTHACNDYVMPAYEGMVSAQRPPLVASVVTTTHQHSNSESNQKSGVVVQIELIPSKSTTASEASAQSVLGKRAISLVEGSQEAVFKEVRRDSAGSTASAAEVSGEGHPFTVSGSAAGGIDKGLVCEMCNKTFTNRFNQRRHMASIHSDNRPFECTCCGLRFKMKDHLTTHMRVSHDSSRRESFKCDQCSITFLTKSNLNRHIRQTHETGELFECADCGKSFKTAFSLERHEKSSSCAI
eukprot:CAMPEP_0184694472 /NCGR_PEP_ID=MMETSP0313-20130426/2418_1 /TAXON_ID=2792 /ORGANISM="Porphyridium aerugineum, Strain SAG 1380-2" /LENGTH=697 /DNA_ID=CAMNT_0027152767 /DNA_START=218 /DNA_END=2311 /DNA_ORIENTATION=-